MLVLCPQVGAEHDCAGRGCVARGRLRERGTAAVPLGNRGRGRPHRTVRLMTLPVNAPEVVRPMIEWVPLEAGKRATLGDVAVQGRAGELQRQVPGARLVVAAEGVGAALRVLATAAVVVRLRFRRSPGE